MTQVRADVLAARLLADGKTVDDIVDATGLEPREVMGIAQKMKHRSKAEFASLADMAQRINAEAGRARYPRKAQTLLKRAADYVAKADQVVADDAGKAALRDKRDRLKAELEKVNAELRGSTGSSAAPQVDTKLVRAWAVANGYTVPKAGRIRGDVVDAYLAATTQAAS